MWWVFLGGFMDEFMREFCRISDLNFKWGSSCEMKGNSLLMIWKCKLEQSWDEIVANEINQWNYSFPMSSSHYFRILSSQLFSFFHLTCLSRHHFPHSHKFPSCSFTFCLTYLSTCVCIFSYQKFNAWLENEIMQSFII